MAKQEKRRVLIVNDRMEWNGYYDPFRHLGEYIASPKILDYAPEQVVCAVFTGGADVHPKHYKQRPSHFTHTSVWRDDYEIDVFRACQRNKIPIFGICRGAQLMCVMAGGTLCQHLTNHEGKDHTIETHDGQYLVVNSYHHQMMLPPEDAEVLAWATPQRSTYYLGDDNDEIEVEKEIEAVHFPSVNGLGVQYHPELHRETDEGWEYYQDLINDFLYCRRDAKGSDLPTMFGKVA
jgi:gamma-glutamyl-gamma-aminobutyrate hydrolase PuuD